MSGKSIIRRSLICKKYGTGEDTDLTDLTNELNQCKLGSKKIDPDKWFAELEYINKELKEIDPQFHKEDKEIVAHMMSNLPKGYRSIKTVIQKDLNYLDDLKEIKEALRQYWKMNFCKKKGNKKQEKTVKKEVVVMRAV